MTLHCPFCHAQEDGRIEAQDESGNEVVLVMFKCAFYYRFPSKELKDSEEGAQHMLDNWRITAGSEWLESIGPVLRERETRNMLKYEQSTRAAGAS
jgi:hypothetical protein